MTHDAAACSLHLSIQRLSQKLVRSSISLLRFESFMTGKHQSGIGKQLSFIISQDYDIYGLEQK